MIISPFVNVSARLLLYVVTNNADWPQHYSSAEEIWMYMKSLVAKYVLGPHLRLKTRILSQTWEDDLNQWKVEIEDISSGEIMQTYYDIM